MVSGVEDHGRLQGLADGVDPNHQLGGDRHQGFEAVWAVVGDDRATSRRLISIRAHCSGGTDLGENRLMTWLTDSSENTGCPAYQRSARRCSRKVLDGIAARVFRLRGSKSGPGRGVVASDAPAFLVFSLCHVSLRYNDSGNALRRLSLSLRAHVPSLRCFPIDSGASITGRVVRDLLHQVCPTCLGKWWTGPSEQ